MGEKSPVNGFSPVLVLECVRACTCVCVRACARAAIVLSINELGGDSKEAVQMNRCSELTRQKFAKVSIERFKLAWGGGGRREHEAESETGIHKSEESEVRGCKFR